MVMMNSVRALLACTVICCFSSSVLASTAIVVADVNVFDDDPLLLDNGQLLLNFLGDNTNVLYSRQADAGPGFRGQLQDGLISLFESLSDVSFTLSRDTLVDDSLSAIDFLVLDLTVNSNNPYSDAEVESINDYLDGGGDLIFVAEAIDADGDESVVSYNDLLTSLAIGIQYEGSERTSGADSDQIFEDPFTEGVNQVELGGINNLLGGTPLVGVEGFTGIAYQQRRVAVVPVPAAAWLLLSGLGMLGLRRTQTPPFKDTRRCDGCS